jgi:hypothetical protein
MSITYEQAVEKLNDWTTSPALRNHARAVEAAMRQAAHRYGAGDADLRASRRSSRTKASRPRLIARRSTPDQSGWARASTSTSSS